MNIKYAIGVVVGIGVGYLLAFNKLESTRYDGYNEGYDEAKERYDTPCARCAKRDAELSEMTDEEFAESSEALEAAAEALSNYQGVTVVSSVLPETMTTTVAKAVERGELDVEIVDVVSKYPDGEPASLVEKQDEPTIKKRLLQKPSDPPVNYNRISTPEKTAEPKTASVATDADKMHVEFITDKSFTDDEFGYKQFTFVYYEGDDVLSNEREDPVEGEARKGIGNEALQILKNGSGPVYVRNHDGKWDFEIIKDDRKYSEVVGPRDPSG
jgi:hypothetical protein